MFDYFHPSISIARRGLRRWSCYSMGILLDPWIAGTVECSQCFLDHRSQNLLQFTIQRFIDHNDIATSTGEKISQLYTCRLHTPSSTVVDELDLAFRFPQDFRRVREVRRGH
jgi:hypothetical protein